MDSEHSERTDIELKSRRRRLLADKGEEEEERADEGGVFMWPREDGNGEERFEWPPRKLPAPDNTLPSRGCIQRVYNQHLERRVNQELRQPQ